MSGLLIGPVTATQLGYTTARTQLLWPLGRMLLHRGDPDLTARAARRETPAA